MAVNNEDRIYHLTTRWIITVVDRFRNGDKKPKVLKVCKTKKEAIGCIKCDMLSFLRELEDMGYITSKYINSDFENFSIVFKNDITQVNCEWNLEKVEIPEVLDYETLRVFALTYFDHHSDGRPNKKFNPNNNYESRILIDDIFNRVATW